MRAKKVKDVLEGGPAIVSSLPKLLPKEGRDESVLDRADRIRDEDDVKFIEVREELGFERGQDPKQAMGIGIKYYLKSESKTVSMGRGSVARQTKWVLYDQGMNEIKYHRQNSWDDEDRKFKGWKEFVKAQGVDPKHVEKI